MIVFAIIIVVVAALGFLIFGGDVLLSMPWNKQKAANAAQEYLAENYQREMRYIRTNYPALNFYARPYTVFFSPADTPDQVFQVMVDKSFRVFEKRTVPNNPELYFSQDSYYLTYFEYNINKPLQRFADEIWGMDVQISSSTNDGFGNFRTPYIFNEQMTAEEMEPYLKYTLFISIDKILDKPSEGEEALRTLQMIECIKTNGNTPERVLFRYKTGKDERGRATDSTIRYIEFKNWQEITRVEEIEKIMDEQWFVNYVPGTAAS